MTYRELEWPIEGPMSARQDVLLWHDQGFNRMLDFHGDPVRSRLALFSDGNHHMALGACIEEFVARNPAVQDVFYLTVPPNLYARILDRGAVRVGNLQLSVAPEVLIGPSEAAQAWREQGRVAQTRAFARSCGNVLLVSAGNPKGIHGIADLYRDDIRVFVSNPETEAASFRVYSETLARQAGAQGLEGAALRERLRTVSPRVMHGRHIHHRELPVALASGQADVAPVYHHLALRYLAIFPGRFEMIGLPGSGSGVPGRDGQVITEYHAGVLGSGGEYGQAFVDFLCSERGGELYRRHGLEVMPDG